MTAIAAETRPVDQSQDTPAQPSAPAARGAQPSKKALWAGRVLTGLAALFLAFDASIKLIQSPEAVEGTTRLGYPAGVLPGLGFLQLACLALYLFPRTAVFGAILWTGYLGGAIATHVRVENPLFSHVLFPIYVALFIWGGLWLRDERLRALIPLRRGSSSTCPSRT